MKKKNLFDKTTTNHWSNKYSPNQAKQKLTDPRAECSLFKNRFTGDLNEYYAMRHLLRGFLSALLQLLSFN